MSGVKISLLLPTRQRPKQLTRMYESAMQTAAHPEQIEVVAYVDDEDGSYDGLKLPRVRYVRGPRQIDGHVNLSVMWNRCYEAAKGEYFLHAGDDLVFLSQGWDTEMTKAIDSYPGKIAVVWGDDWNDGSERGEFGTHCMVHKNWVETVGYFVPPYFVSDYNDTFFNDLGIKLHVRKYLHHVKIEHYHITRGKAEMDDNTKERLERHDKERPQDIYYSPAFQTEIEQKREALQAYINRFKKLSILICALGRRNEQLVRLCAHLREMIADKPVEVLVCWDNFESPVAKKRQALLDAAHGEYVCFVDDDDELPEYYIDRILPLLDGVDYIGWRMQLYTDGVAQKPTFHSLRYDRWSEDENGYYRNVSHLNPIKRTIALTARFDAPRGTAEDVSWAAKVHPKTEHYIDDVMYFYRHERDGSLWDKENPPKEIFDRPELPFPFQYVEVSDGHA